MVTPNLRCIDYQIGVAYFIVSADGALYRSRISHVDTMPPATILVWAHAKIFVPVSIYLILLVLQACALGNRGQGNTETVVIVVVAIVVVRVEHTCVSAIVPVAAPFEPRVAGIDEIGVIAAPEPPCRNGQQLSAVALR